MQISVSKRRDLSARRQGVMLPTIMILKLVKIIPIFDTSPSPTENKGTVGKVPLWSVKAGQG